VFRAAGLFDETYFFSGEMADLCQRAARRGFLCRVSPAARAAHETHRASALRDTLYAYYSLRNRFLYVRKFHPRLKFALLPGWTACGALMGARALLTGRAAKARAVALALRDGLLSRYGDRNDAFIR
jgi:GT2 family glycosyltransferase